MKASAGVGYCNLKGIFREVPRYYEFFAGGGMVRAGLGPSWRCAFANDIDPKKSHAYTRNWGGAELKTSDVAALTPEDLPGRADLAWASFPCQDLSLAGVGAGLRGERSGTFRPFWNLMRALIKDDRAPAMIVLENVCGALTSHQGKDFATICSSYGKAGYRLGALVVDAALFVPQSRARLFVIGVKKDLHVPGELTDEGEREEESPGAKWRPRPLRAAHDRLPAEARGNWIWWQVPAPPPLDARFADLIEDEPTGVAWNSGAETSRLLAMMSEVNRAKVEQAKRSGRRMVGAIYKRTRRDGDGLKVQRAEIRFDDIAGCLRTPTGGSSRQSILVVEGDRVESRLLSSRETARLMGLPEDYRLPENYNEAYHLTGDGVVVPVVRHLAAHLFEPLLAANRRARAGTT
jgi:DNA (cytosine-5)-methyltransferase 1